jgi:hypothetical protein
MATASMMKVKELQALLASCDPEGEVRMFLPAWVFDNDPALADSEGVELGASFDVSVASEMGTGRPADIVSIRWADEDSEGARQRRIEEARMQEEPEPIQGDADNVVVDVLISRSTHAAMRRVVRDANTSSGVREGACTHGALTVSSLLGMLAEDVGMVETRPGSWEGANMTTVLESHGYTT